jgi:SAM-dependent methyltransferase
VKPASELAPDVALRLRYDADLAALLPRFRSRFASLTRDAATDTFLKRAAQGRATWWRTQLHRIARQFMSDFDANGLLDMYPLFVASTEQWRALLGEARVARLLDVGAGSGIVTQTLVPLAERVITTELSSRMAARLRSAGLVCHELDLAEAELPEERFDLITCLNVLDRTARPRRLLARLCDSLEPGGRLVVALVLPYRPFYYRGATTPEPLERLACADASWEGAVNRLIEREFEPLGLTLCSVSRAPYLSFGDAECGLYELDDALFVLQKT